MRILFLGDIVGSAGVEVVRWLVPMLIAEDDVQLVIANAENVCNGGGLTPKQHRQLRLAGVDLITMGDQIYRRSELIPMLETEATIAKPANFPSDAPGRDVVYATARDGTRVAAFCVLGRNFMGPVDCPFKAADRVLTEVAEKANVVVVDVHAEATSDKYLLAHYLRGRVSAVVGTHTCVQTADEQLMSTTAFITDAGMTGPYNGIVGRCVDRMLAHALFFVPVPAEAATEDPRLCGAIIDVDPVTGHATSIQRIQEKYVA